MGAICSLINSKINPYNTTDISFLFNTGRVSFKKLKFIGVKSISSSKSINVISSWFITGFANGEGSFMVRFRKKF